MSCALPAASRRSGSLEPEIRRYAKPFRKWLRKLARTSSRLGDLIVSFPAAAFAMVSNRGAADARGAAVRLVRDGAPLPQVAAALKLPSWTRWLAPEAFREPFDALETDAAFDRMIAGHVSRAAEEQAMWFEWLLAARRFGDESFAVWLAKQDIYAGEPAPVEAVIPLAAYAWHSVRPTAGLRAQMNKFWHAKMGFNSAASEARGWLARVLKERCRAPVEIRGGWWKAQSVNGFKISPRDTKAQLEAEGRAMDNCVASYWDKVRHGECLIYSIRRGGSPVATMEIQGDRQREGSALVSQLAGPSNAPVTAQVWRAAEAWLRKQGPCPLRSRGSMAIGSVEDDRWVAAWAEYAAEHPGEAMFAAAPTLEDLRRLELGYAALGRAAKR